VVAVAVTVAMTGNYDAHLGVYSMSPVLFSFSEVAIASFSRVL
jgi:hypothetical protein